MTDFYDGAHMDAHGYEYINWASHPLANRSGKVFVHRMVLFDEIGWGLHPCHWCGKLLPWDEIRGDHLNWIRNDNRLENLVVSCGPCNSRRTNPATKRYPGGPFNW
jgi:hypothetical protein